MLHLTAAASHEKELKVRFKMLLIYFSLFMETRTLTFWLNFIWLVSTQIRELSQHILEKDYSRIWPFASHSYKDGSFL